MARHRPRPRRGQPGPDILVSGDVGEYHPQGGARLVHAFRESGDLASREFGVPEADLPGGKGHVINPETDAADPAIPPERPADYHKYHGVPSDDGLYVVPDAEVGESERPAPVPKLHDAVPVYIVAQAGPKAKVIRALVTEGPQTIASGTVDPVRIADQDPQRTKLWICNETTPAVAGGTGPGIRIGDWETAADQRGLLVPAGQIKDFNTQAAVFATNQSGSPVTISWGYETEIQAPGV